jgi:hypothetical protein
VIWFGVPVVIVSFLTAPEISPELVTDVTAYEYVPGLKNPLSTEEPATGRFRTGPGLDRLYEKIELETSESALLAPTVPGQVVPSYLHNSYGAVPPTAHQVKDAAVAETGFWQ